MKYATDPFTGLHWRFDDVFNYCGNDENGLFYAYERKPIKRKSGKKKGCFSGGYYSQDLMITQPDSFYPDWENSVQRLKS